jgi:hypothetical protein
MKSFSLWISAAAIGMAVGLAGNVWCQTTTESSDSTVTTVPAAPSVTSKTVTTNTQVNPPVVVARPSSSSSSQTTTTQSDTPYEPAPSVQENSKSKTSYGPFGVTHSESSDKTTSD